MDKKTNELLDALRLALEAKSETRGKEEGVKLIRRLEKAEKAFPRAYEFFSQVNTAKGRKKIARLLQDGGYKIQPEDLEGAIAVPPDKLVNEMKEKYGLRTFPLILSVPKEKWRTIEEKEGIADKLNLSKTEAGIAIHSYNLPRPFKEIGTIIVISPSYISERHEALHQSANIYRAKKSGLKGKEFVDSSLVRELFARLSEVNKPIDWINMGNNLAQWMHWINYYSNWINNHSRSEKHKISNKDKAELIYKVRKALRGIAYLHLKTSQSIVAQTILNSDSLDELANWEKYQLVKYKDTRKEKQLEGQFCQDVANYFKRTAPRKYGKAQTALYRYHFSALRKKDVKRIVEEEYAKKEDGWKYIRA